MFEIFVISLFLIKFCKTIVVSSVRLRDMKTFLEVF